MGDSAEWGVTEHLLAHVVDLTARANWQRGGGKGRKPKPIQRPGAESRKEHIQMDRFESPAAFDEWWVKNGGAPPPKPHTKSTAVAVFDPTLARIAAS
jgi:hypothetical protein